MLVYVYGNLLCLLHRVLLAALLLLYFIELSDTVHFFVYLVRDVRLVFHLRTRIRFLKARDLVPASRNLTSILVLRPCNGFHDQAPSNCKGLAATILQRDNMGQCPADTLEGNVVFLEHLFLGVRLASAYSVLPSIQPALTSEYCLHTTAFDVSSCPTISTLFMLALCIAGQGHGSCTRFLRGRIGTGV